MSRKQERAAGTGENLVASNRKARFQFELLDRYEAGLVLEGWEVKSLRTRGANFNDSFARLVGNEVFLFNLHIPPYGNASTVTQDTRRPRKLLLHKRQIRKLIGKVQERGLTLVPLRVYFTRGLAKVEIALARGKKLYDKRHAIAEREQSRKILRGHKTGTLGEE